MINLTDATLRKEMKLATTPIEKTRRLNSRRSSIGASALSSHQMKPTRSDTNATEAAAMGAEVQPLINQHNTCPFRRLG